MHLDTSLLRAFLRPCLPQIQTRRAPIPFRGQGEEKAGTLALSPKHTQFAETMETGEQDHSRGKALTQKWG